MASHPPSAVSASTFNLTPWQAVSGAVVCTAVGGLLTAFLVYSSSTVSSFSSSSYGKQESTLPSSSSPAIPHSSSSSSRTVSVTLTENTTTLSTGNTSTGSSSSPSFSAAAYEEKINFLQKELLAERNGRTKAERMLRDRTHTTLITQGYPTLPIGYLSSPCRNRRGTPRQGALTPDVRAKIICLSALPAQCFEGIEEFSHVYVLFLFHENTDLHKLYSLSDASASSSSSSPFSLSISDPYTEAENSLKSRSYQSRVQPPALMGKKTGIFATRSPHRPNAIGLSLCRLVSVQQEEETLPNKKKKVYTTVLLDGCDLVDGTPIIDIKPYGYFDCPTCVGSLVLKENLYRYDTDETCEEKRDGDGTVEKNNESSKVSLSPITETDNDATLPPTAESSLAVTLLPATNLPDAITVMKQSFDIRTPTLYKSLLYPLSTSTNSTTNHSTNKNSPLPSTIPTVPLSFPSLWYYRRVPSWVSNSLRYQEKYRLPIVWSKDSIEQLSQYFYDPKNKSKFYSPRLPRYRTTVMKKNNGKHCTDTPQHDSDHSLLFPQYEYYALVQALTQVLALDIRAVHLGRGKEAVTNKVSVYGNSSKDNNESTLDGTELASVSSSSSLSISEGQEYEIYYDNYRLRFYFRNVTDSTDEKSIDSTNGGDTMIPDPEQVRNTYIYVRTVELSVQVEN